MLLPAKTALVTGAAKGIGKGIALQLAAEGCDVAVNDYGDAAGAEATASEIRALGRQALVVLANVGDAGDVDGMFHAVFKQFPRLDILVNNAGVQTWKALLDLEDPRKVLRRSDEWLFTPTENYEREGDVDEVVFPCGWLLDGEEVRIYYGAADTCLAVATARLSDLLAWLDERSPDFSAMGQPHA